MPLVVRSFDPGDAEPLGRLFHRAVREGAAAHYDADQRAAWSPAPPDGAGWTARLAEAETVVAEQAGEIVGFMSLVVTSGYLDLAYVAPEVMGGGVADALYAVLETRARCAGPGHMTSDASELARPFFERHGWQVIARQEIVRGGVTMHNYRMEKTLRSKAVA